MNEIIAPPHNRWPRKRFFKRLAWTAAGSCALGGLFAWKLEEHWLKVEQRDMPLKGLGKGLDGALLAHISDMHSSPIVLEQYLRHCIHEINRLNVDFVAVTGDFVTGPKHYVHRAARVLKELRPAIAAVACLGNHDYGVFHPNGLGGMRGLSEYVTRELGHADVFVMLNESRVFRRDGAEIQFVGLEDYWTTRYNPKTAFEMAQPHLPTIALCHNPDAAPHVAQYGAQWVLAGHTHGSPVKETKLYDMVLPATRKQFFAGEYDLGQDRRLYVNRGLGYARRWNLNARPEITLFTLRAV